MVKTTKNAGVFCAGDLIRHGFAVPPSPPGEGWGNDLIRHGSAVPPSPKGDGEGPPPRAFQFSILKFQFYMKGATTLSSHPATRVGMGMARASSSVTAWHFAAVSTKSRSTSMTAGMPHR